MTGTVATSAQHILRLGNAFCEAQALFTAVEVDLFSALHDGPATVADLRDRLGLHGRGLRDLLQLLVQLGLLHEENGRYRNTADADLHLVQGQTEYLGGLLRGTKANLYPVWDGLADALRTGRPRTGGDDFIRMLDDPGQLRRYAAMMDGVLRPLIPRLLAAVDWSRHRWVLDVGGCQGRLVGQLAMAHPELTGQVFDLPQMEPVFHEHMAQLGTADRTEFHCGDFFRDDLPTADVVILGHILHNWDYPQREQLVRKAFLAVRPGGILLVHDRMLDDEHPRIENLVASLTMALVTEQGSEYPIGELTALAAAAGFASVEHRSLDENETLVLCHKASAS